MNKRRKHNIRKLYKKRIKQYIDLGIELDKEFEKCSKSGKSITMGLSPIVLKEYQTEDRKVVIYPKIDLDVVEYEKDPEDNKFKRVEYGFITGEKYLR